MLLRPAEPITHYPAYYQGEFIGRATDPEAPKRAEKLLLENLTEEQRADYKRERCFIATSPCGRRFRISYGKSQNIDEIDKSGYPTRNWCIHTSLECPTEDHLLAQKLIIENDFERFKRVAQDWGQPRRYGRPLTRF